MTREDPRFPGLGTALDPEAMLGLLRSAFPECGEGLALLDLNVSDVRYRPGGPCWILYRLKVRQGRRRSVRIYLSAQVLRDDEQPHRIPARTRSRFGELHKHPFRTPHVYLKEAHVAIYVFPVDSSLPGLFDASDPSLMRRHLSRLWARRDVRVNRVEVENRGYTPHARAAFSYEALCENRTTGEPEMRRLIGKMHAKKNTARVFADTWALWQAGKHTVSLAPPVGYIGSIGLTLQERVRGERLGGQVDQPGFLRKVRTTARMLAAMHSLRVPLGTRRKPAEEAAGVHRWAGVLAAIRPDIAPRIENLRDRLAAEIESRTRLTGPIHADFHHTNVLVDDDHITIIDLDEMAFGDPMVDVGRFMASLRVPARRAFGDLRALDDAAELFLTEYLSRAGGDEARARLFEAGALLIAAGSSFRVQRGNWKEEVSLLLEEAESRFDAATVTTTGTGDIRPPAPAPEDRVTWARDGIYMQAVLDPHIRKVYGAQITRCRVAGKQPEGRVRYALRGYQEDERWEVTLEGILGRERGARSFLKRLETLRGKLADDPNAPLLPRPVAHIKPLSLMVWEVPSGIRFSSMLGTREARTTARLVGEALATIHGAPVTFERQRSVDRELSGLESRVARLQELHPDLAERAKAIWERISERADSSSERTVPVVRTVHPHHVLRAGNRVALAKIEDLMLGHPYLDVADFLARLALLDINEGGLTDMASVADDFREAYLRAGDGGDPEGMAIFEAGALLRMACLQAPRDPDGRSSGRLLEEAELRLAS